MLNNNMLVEYLENNGIEVEILKNMEGCKCNECSLLNDIMENLTDNINLNIYDIENIIPCNDLYDGIQGGIFESCIDCINDYSHRLYCKYCDYHGIQEIDAEFVTTNDWLENTYCMASEGDAWVECVECGEILNVDDAYFDYDSNNHYCSDCYQKVTFDIEDNYVYDYHEFTNYHTIGESYDGIYFGFEIETASDDKLNDLRNFIEYSQYDFPNWETYFHIERDCSITGYEFISQPMDYETLKEVIPTMTNLLKKSGFYVNNQCGSHIHVTRTEKSEGRLFDMLTFFNNNKRFTLNFANRTLGKMQEWSDFYNYDISEIKRIATNKSFGGRYRVINLTNSKTLEFRLFSGTLTHQKIIGNVQLIQCLLNENINGLSDYRDLLEHGKRYKLLYQSIKSIEHNLY